MRKKQGGKGKDERNKEDTKFACQETFFLYGHILFVSLGRYDRSDRGILTRRGDTFVCQKKREGKRGLRSILQFSFLFLSITKNTHDQMYQWRVDVKIGQHQVLVAFSLIGGHAPFDREVRESYQIPTYLSVLRRLQNFLLLPHM
jgi:hypothetical protein